MRKFLVCLSVCLSVCLFSQLALAACTGTAVKACSAITDQSTCGQNYIPNKNGGTQCGWNGSYCSNSGGNC